MEVREHLAVNRSPGGGRVPPVLSAHPRSWGASGQFAGRCGAAGLGWAAAPAAEKRWLTEARLASASVWATPSKAGPAALFLGSK